MPVKEKSRHRVSVIGMPKRKNEKKRMPVKEKSRHRASMIGMLKRENEEKGCR